MRGETEFVPSRFDRRNDFWFAELAGGDHVPRRMRSVSDKSPADRFASPALAVVFGLMTAVLIAGGLYFALSDALIVKRSISIPPPTPVGRVNGPEALTK